MAAAAAAVRPTKIIAGATAFGAPLKDELISVLRNLGLPVEDLGAGDSIAADVGLRVSSSRGSGARGLVVCGDGVSGVVLANKFPGASATACFSVDDAVNVRSICNSNILAISALSTPLGPAVQILHAWLETPFKSSCLASNGQPWSDDVQESLDRAQIELARIGVRTLEADGCDNCAICRLVNPQVPNPFEMIPGGSVKIIKGNPMSATVKFEAGSIEPAHHHTSGHEQLVLKGKMSVWNLSKKKRYDLLAGDYLFTPGGDVHMVKYHEDTKFFVNWHGHCDMFFDQDLSTA